MNKITRRYKFIDSKIPSDKIFDTLPFVRQCEFGKEIASFKDSAKSSHISQKRQSAQKAISDFVKLNDAKQFYTVFHDKAKSPDYWEDTFEIWYKN